MTDAEKKLERIRILAGQITVLADVATRARNDIDRKYEEVVKLTEELAEDAARRAGESE